LLARTRYDHLFAREAIDDDVSEPTEQASIKALPEANGG
jgi:hypothetical protein